MIRLPLRVRPWIACLALAAAAFPAGAVAAGPRYSTPPSVATEAKTLISLLEQYHYNRDGVRSADYAEVIPDYMEALDGQRLFFLETDRAAFIQRYGGTYIHENVSYLGNIDAAYEMFYVYERRARERIQWIQAELGKPIDFGGDETYRADRSKSDWPRTVSEADSLWHKRIKYELIAEILNKKTSAQAREIVRKRYERMRKSLDDIDEGDLSEMYLAAIAGLYDPHSTYMSADTYGDFGIQMKLQLIGIGAVLSIEEDQCVVKEIVPGSPADLGHELKPDDRILEVAQEGGEPIEITGMKLRKIVDLIRGQKGTRVHLTVEPADAADTAARKQIVITRNVVKLNSQRAHAAVFQVPGADGKPVPLGVITLPAFYGSGDDTDPGAPRTSASADVARLIPQLQAKHIQGLVLDLRHNGGGLLGEAIEVAGLFIHQGPVVQVRDAVGDVSAPPQQSEHLAYHGPMVVLTDRFSASASEIVAGALQNYGRAVVIGDSSTHGKGSVQTLLEMKSISRELADSTDKTGAAKLTTQKFYLPDGESTQLKGVVPDIILPSIDDYLPIGESDLPHALGWDRIASATFAGTPIDLHFLARLREASVRRQGSLDEFALLRRSVGWFKAREAQKLVALNLLQREHQRDADDAFRKEIDASKDRLEKFDYPYQAYRLTSDGRVEAAPPPTVSVAASAVPAAKTTPIAAAASAAPAPSASAAAVHKSRHGDADEDEDDPFEGQNDAYAHLDICLRESLRVLDDAIDLGHSQGTWVGNHPPVTVADRG